MAIGILRSALFLRPVEASLDAVSSDVSKGNLRPDLRAHRTIELSPRAQSSAQRRAARMIAMLVSKSAWSWDDPRVRFWVAFWVIGTEGSIPNKERRRWWVKHGCSAIPLNLSQAASMLEIESRIRAFLNLNNGGVITHLNIRFSSWNLPAANQNAKRFLLYHFYICKFGSWGKGGGWSVTIDAMRASQLLKQKLMPLTVLSTINESKQHLSVH